MAERKTNALDFKKRHEIANKMQELYAEISGEEMSYEQVARRLTKELRFEVTVDNVDYPVRRGVVPPWKGGKKTRGGAAWLFTTTKALQAEVADLKSRLEALEESDRRLAAELGLKDQKPQPTLNGKG